MSINMCLKCGQGIAQQGGLCANCILNTDITDKLDFSVPKIDAPQEMFFGPDLSDYVKYLTNRRDEKSGKYSTDKTGKTTDKTSSTRYNFDKKYDITATRNGVVPNTAKNGVNKKYSGQGIYDLITSKIGGQSAQAKPKDAKYVFAQYNMPVTVYTGKKPSYGITASNRYMFKPYITKGNSYNGKKSSYSGIKSNSTYSGSGSNYKGSSAGSSGKGASK